MKSNEIALIVIAVLAALLIIYFITARGPTKRLVLSGSDGSEVPVDVEVANSTATRMKGLMGRASLGENEGMLFVFDKPGKYPFWMLNTSIPLDAIHIAENGTVVDIIAMKPCGLNITGCPTYPPRAEAKYVLEVNQGFAARHAIESGKSRVKSWG